MQVECLGDRGGAHGSPDLARVRHALGLGRRQTHEGPRLRRDRQHHPRDARKPRRRLGVRRAGLRGPAGHLAAHRRVAAWRHAHARGGAAAAAGRPADAQGVRLGRHDRGHRGRDPEARKLGAEHARSRLEARTRPRPERRVRRAHDVRPARRRQGRPVRRQLDVHRHVPADDGAVDDRERPAEEAVRPLPVHPLEPLPVVRRGTPGAGHHDEPEPPGGEGPVDGDERLRGEPALGAGAPEPALALRRAARARLVGAGRDAETPDRAAGRHPSRRDREGRRQAVSRRERRPGVERAGAARPAARPAPRTGVPASPARAAAPAPALWRDPWALATALAVVPLLVRCAGAPLGEAVAEAFDFLRRSLFIGVGSLLDGGGSTAFWRPLAHQVYYAALGPLIVSQPLVVALLHVLLLLAGSLLVYGALRPHLGGTAACVAASFPMLSESTRTLVSWPSQFVDVGLYFFSAVSLHETARRRLPSALTATLLALFCKELAVIPALLLPWFPDARPREERRRWAIAFGGLIVAWAAAYLGVRHAAGLHLPHGLEQLATPLPKRIAWAFGGTLRAFASLPLAHVPEDTIALALGIGLVVAFAACVAMAPSVRARLHEQRAWIAWGSAWFGAGALALASIFPLWQPNRAQFASTGAGIATAVALEAAHPALGGALVLGRGVLLFLAPAAASVITEEPPDAGAFMDFARLSRLQRFMSLTRRALHASYPHAEPHAHVVEMNLPRGLMYAFGENRAVQVWYRDTTLSMVNFKHLNRDSTLSMVAGVQYQ